MAILVQFLLRLSFGLAAGMAVTSSRQVSSGFFRNHLYVTLGLTSLAALVTASSSAPVMWLSVAAAVLSYIGSVAWLYEAKRFGQWMLWLVASFSLLAAWTAIALWVISLNVASPGTAKLTDGQLTNNLRLAAVVPSSLVLGLSTAAMLLGHWYLNSPGMELAPLRRLLRCAAAAVGLQIVVSASGLVANLAANANPTFSWWMLVALRWSFGLMGVLALLWMAWQTLKIPNTQSATGILYVAIVGVFVGELTGLLLSAESAFPL
jgi:hypothetical protein